MKVMRWSASLFNFVLMISPVFPAGSAGAAPLPAVLSTGLINERAPYPECHASTIVETAPGKFIAAWFGGTRERHPDVCIYVSHL